MRAFLAIDLPDEIAAALALAQAGLKAGRPVPRDNLHLTLAFLGDQPEFALTELDHELTALRYPSFELRFTGFGTFGNMQPRSLYADIGASPELAGLHKAIRGAVRRAGIVLPHQRYVPHVTIARFRREQADMAAAAVATLMRGSPDFRAGPFAVRDVVLFGSTLNPDGAQHEALARYPLS